MAKEDAFIRSLEKVDVEIDGVTYNLVAASFRGVSFFVDNFSQGGCGRNIVTKKIPMSDDYVIEDNGKNVPSNSINFYLVGDDCNVQRQKLIRACAQEGSAEIVHPWLGRFNGRCSSLEFSSARNSLGYVNGTISFIEDSAIPAKVVEASLAGVTKSKSKTFMDKVCDGFAATINAAKKTKSFVDGVADATDYALDVVDNARQGLREVNAFVNELGKIKANVQLLMDTPKDFANRIKNILATTAEIFGLSSDKKSDLDEYLNIVRSSKNDVVGRYNAKLAVAMAASSLVDAKFDSVDDAASYQDRFSEVAEILLESTDDIDEYMSLNELTASALSYLRDTMQSMASVIEKDNNGFTNILSFVFNTYGNLEKVDDVMSRNSFSQGLFIPPGKVKVLSK